MSIKRRAIKDSEKRIPHVTAKGGTLLTYPPGVSGNPGGVPKGKRVATWMAEYGEIGASEWPKGAELRKLPANAVIALQRLRCALKRDSLGLRNSEYVEPRARPEAGDGEGQISIGNIERIAAAIAALKAAGVEFRRAPAAIDTTAQGGEGGREG